MRFTGGGVRQEIGVLDIRGTMKNRMVTTFDCFLLDQ